MVAVRTFNQLLKANSKEILTLTPYMTRVSDILVPPLEFHLLQVEKVTQSKTILIDLTYNLN